MHNHLCTCLHATNTHGPVCCHQCKQSACDSTADKLCSAPRFVGPSGLQRWLAPYQWKVGHHTSPVEQPLIAVHVFQNSNGGLDQATENRTAGFAFCATWAEAQAASAYPSTRTCPPVCKQHPNVFCCTACSFFCQPSSSWRPSCNKSSKKPSLLVTMLLCCASCCCISHLLYQIKASEGL